MDKNLISCSAATTCECLVPPPSVHAHPCPSPAPHLVLSSDLTFSVFLTNSHTPTELCMFSWGLGTRGIERHLLIPCFPPKKLETWLLHLYFLGPGGPLGRVGMVEGWTGPARGKRMCALSRLPTAESKSDYLPLSLATCASWPWSPLRSPLRSPLGGEP